MLSSERYSVFFKTVYYVRHNCFYIAFSEGFFFGAKHKRICNAFMSQSYLSALVNIEYLDFFKARTGKRFDFLFYFSRCGFVLAYKGKISCYGGEFRQRSKRFFGRSCVKKRIKRNFRSVEFVVYSVVFRNERMYLTENAYRFSVRNDFCRAARVIGRIVGAWR